MLNTVDEEEMDSIDMYGAVHQGRGFTGYLREFDSGFINYETYINGISRGPDYVIDGEGVLDSFYHKSVGQIVLGGLYRWGQDGELLSEKIIDDAGRVRTLKEWDRSGGLIVSKVGPEMAALADSENKMESWKSLPQIYPPEEVKPGQFAMTVSADHLEFDGTRDRYMLNGHDYTGNIYYENPAGTVEVRTMVHGSHEGSVFRWSARGIVIAQGMCRHPYGLVGPWHEWDELGLLLREIIYDAVGNKIIHRELDEAQNIVSQEYFDPITLMTDPETGEKYPAPWL